MAVTGELPLDPVHGSQRDRVRIPRYIHPTGILIDPSIHEHSMPSFARRPLWRGHVVEVVQVIGPERGGVRRAPSIRACYGPRVIQECYARIGDVCRMLGRRSDPGAAMRPND